LSALSKLLIYLGRSSATTNHQFPPYLCALKKYYEQKRLPTTNPTGRVLRSARRSKLSRRPRTRVHRPC
jgi:hypothetical protein